MVVVAAANIETARAVAAFHSCGLESLEGLLGDYLQAAGLLVCAFSVRSLSLARDASWGELPGAQRLALNAGVSALKMARESRNASALTGRRLLHLLEHWVDAQRQP
ncbi:hypothetical protein [Thermogemmatispora sp.]|uniref:hypothetical protein n=1 Tax=Thermogemmatispora sp. TaxID=1968838 RepID=UPI0035E44C46